MIQFHYPLVALMIIPAILVILYHTRPKGSMAILLVASRLVIMSFIILSMASPYTEEYVHGIAGGTDVIVIADGTESMRLFDPPDDVYAFLSNRTPTAIDYISGTASPIGDAIIRNAKSGGSILLISDGNNNDGRSIPEAVSFARSLNATVYYLRQEPVKKDMSVSIEGDALAVLETQAGFDVNIITVGDLEGDLKVWIDGKVVFDDRITGVNRIPLIYSFTSVGSHTIKAELTAKDDEIPQNNVFYRSVHVVPRPQVLLLSNGESPLSQIMKASYSVNSTAGLADAGNHKAVILDDMSAAGLSFSDALTLSDYVINGGGLVVVGGQNAFSDYGKKPLLEQLIPVKYGGIPPKTAKTAVVFVVDISGSTGDLSGSDLKLGIEKGLTIQVLDDLGVKDIISVIAFNNAPHIIVPFAQYAERSKVKDAIQRLRYGGTTRLSPALSAAHDMLKDFEGGRNVIVISDGVVADGEAALMAARSMSEDGITIYSIGVGGDTDADFMTRLSEAGGGGYLRRDAAHGIKALFGEKEAGDRGEGYSLRIINSGHFITKDAELNATVYGYNNVHSKQNAQTLVMTDDGNPVVAAWRVGLGRVVSITVDNGNSWAPALYAARNSKLIINSINYAVGNPDGLEIRVIDGEIGKPIEVIADSDSEPGLTFDGMKLQFERSGERQFKTVIYPNSTGFHDLSGYAVGVNVQSEYRIIGNDELMPSMISTAGGRSYNISELGELKPDIEKKKTGTIRQVTDLRGMFLLSALILYTVEVLLRRIIELIQSPLVVRNSR